MARIADGFDRFGNPEGRAFDLGGGDEDRVRGERILLYTCIGTTSFAEQELRALMAERGLRLDIREAPSFGGCYLDAQLLAAYSQLWFVSGGTPTLSEQQVQMIVNYVRSGNGLAIWADNDPLYADANLLAWALTGSHFSGNRPADGVMVPGSLETPGRFVEHQLTQGVDNLYEGITICTIDPVPGVTILGMSHDGQRCIGCFEQNGQRVVLDTGFTKLYKGYYQKSAGLGRYLSNIAFWLARGSRGVEYELLSHGRSELASIKKGETSKEYRFDVSEAAAAICIVQWDGKATLGVTVRAPDGSVAGRRSSSSSPLRAAVLTPAPGTWACMVEGIDVPSAGVTYAAKVALETPGGHSDTGRRPVAPDKDGFVLPFYLVCDVSAAAAGTIEEFARGPAEAEERPDARSGHGRDCGTESHHLPRNGPHGRSAGGSVCDRTARAVGRRRRVVQRRHPGVPPGLRGGSCTAQGRGRQGLPPLRVLPGPWCLAGPPSGDVPVSPGFDPSTGQGNRAYPNVIAIGLPGTTQESIAGLAYPDFGDPARRGRWFVADPPPRRWMVTVRWSRSFTGPSPPAMRPPGTDPPPSPHLRR